MIVVFIYFWRWRVGLIRFLPMIVITVAVVVVLVNVLIRGFRENEISMKSWKALSMFGGVVLIVPLLILIGPAVFGGPSRSDVEQKAVDRVEQFVLGSADEYLHVDAEDVEGLYQAVSIVPSYSDGEDVVMRRLSDVGVSSFTVSHSGDYGSSEAFSGDSVWVYWYKSSKPSGEPSVKLFKFDDGVLVPLIDYVKSVLQPVG